MPQFMLSLQPSGTEALSTAGAADTCTIMDMPHNYNYSCKMSHACPFHPSMVLPCQVVAKGQGDGGRPNQLGCSWTQLASAPKGIPSAASGDKSRSAYTDAAMAKAGVIMRGASMVTIASPSIPINLATADSDNINGGRHVSPPAAMLSHGAEELLQALKLLETSGSNSSSPTWLSGRALVWVSPLPCSKGSEAERSLSPPSSKSVSPERDQANPQPSAASQWYSIRGVSAPSLRIGRAKEGQGQGQGQGTIPLYSEGPTATLAIGREASTCNLNLVPHSTEQQAVVSRRHCELDVRLVEYTFDAILKELDVTDHATTAQDTQITSVARKSMLKTTLRLRCCATVMRDCGTINGTLLWGYKLPSGGQSGEMLSLHEESIHWQASTGMWGTATAGENPTSWLARSASATLPSSSVSDIYGNTPMTSPAGPTEAQLEQLTVANQQQQQQQQRRLYTNSANDHATLCIQLGAAASFKGGVRVWPTKNIHVTLHLTAKLGAPADGPLPASLTSAEYGLVVLGHMAPYTVASEATGGLAPHPTNGDRAQPVTPMSVVASAKEVAALVPRVTTPALPVLMEGGGFGAGQMDGWKIARHRGGQSPVPQGGAPMSPQSAQARSPPQHQHNQMTTLPPEKGVQHLYRDANTVLEGILAAGVAEGSIAAASGLPGTAPEAGRQSGRLTLSDNQQHQRQLSPSSGFMSPKSALLSPVTASAPNEAHTSTISSATARAVRVTDELLARQQATKEVFDVYRQQQLLQHRQPDTEENEPPLQLHQQHEPLQVQEQPAKSPTPIAGPTHKSLAMSDLAADSHYGKVLTTPNPSHLQQQLGSGSVRGAVPPSGTLYAFSSMLEVSPANAVEGSAPVPEEPPASRSGAPVDVTHSAAAHESSYLAIGSYHPAADAAIAQPSHTSDSTGNIIVSSTHHTNTVALGSGNTIVAATALSDHHQQPPYRPVPSDEPTHQSYLGYQSDDDAMSLNEPLVIKKVVPSAVVEQPQPIRNLFEPVVWPPAPPEVQDLDAHDNAEAVVPEEVVAEPETPARPLDQPTPAATTPADTNLTELVPAPIPYKDMDDEDDAPVVLLKGGRQRTFASMSVSAANSPMAGRVSDQPHGNTNPGIALPASAFVKITKVAIPEPTRSFANNRQATPESLSPAQVQPQLLEAFSPPPTKTTLALATKRSLEDGPDYLESTLRGPANNGSSLNAPATLTNYPPIAAETQKHYDDVHAMLEVHLSQERYGLNHDIAPREVLPALSRALTQAKPPPPPPKLTPAQRKAAKKQQIMQENAMRVASFVAELRADEAEKERNEAEGMSKPKRKLLRPDMFGDDKGGSTQFEGAIRKAKVNYGGYSSHSSDDDVSIGAVAQKDERGNKATNGPPSSQKRLAAELKAQLNFMSDADKASRSKRKGKGFAGEDDDASSQSDDQSDDEEAAPQTREDVRVVRIGSGVLVRNSGGSGLFSSQAHGSGAAANIDEDDGLAAQLSPEDLLAAPSQTQQRLFRGTSDTSAPKLRSSASGLDLNIGESDQDEPPLEGLVGRSTVYVIDTRHAKPVASSVPSYGRRSSYRETLADTPFPMTGEESQVPAARHSSGDLGLQRHSTALLSQRGDLRRRPTATLDLAGAQLMEADEEHGVKAALTRLHERQATVVLPRRGLHHHLSPSVAAEEARLLARPTIVLDKTAPPQPIPKEAEHMARAESRDDTFLMDSQGYTQQSMVLVASQFYDTQYIDVRPREAVAIGAKRSRSPEGHDEDVRYSQYGEEPMPASSQPEPQHQQGSQYLSCLADLSQEQSIPVPVEEVGNSPPGPSAAKDTSRSPPPMHVPKRTKATKASERHKRCMNAIHAALAKYNGPEGIVVDDGRSSIGGHLANKDAIYESDWQAAQAGEEDALIREAQEGHDPTTLDPIEEVMQRTLNADAHNKYLIEYPPMGALGGNRPPSADFNPYPALVGRVALPDSQAPDAYERGLVAASHPTVAHNPLPNAEALVVPRHLHLVLHSHQRDAMRFLWSRLMYRSFAGWFGDNARACDKVEEDAITSGLMLLATGRLAPVPTQRLTPLTQGAVTTQGMYALIQLALAPAAQKQALVAAGASPRGGRRQPTASPSAALMAAIQSQRREGQALKKAERVKSNKKKEFKFSFEGSDGSLASGSEKSDGDDEREEDTQPEASEPVQYSLSPNQEVALGRACALSQLVWMLALNQRLDLATLSTKPVSGTPTAPIPVPDASRSVILAHSMGLGKTLSSISFLAALWRFAESQRPSVTMAVQSLFLDTFLAAHAAYEDVMSKKLQLESDLKKKKEIQKAEVKKEGGGRRISFGGGVGGGRQGGSLEEITDPAPPPRDSDPAFSELLRQMTALPASILFGAAIKEAPTANEAPILTFASVRTILVVPKSVTFHWIKEFSLWAPYTSSEEPTSDEATTQDGSQLQPPPVSIFYLSGDKQHAKGKKAAKDGINLDAPPAPPKATALRVANPFPNDHRATLVTDWANTTDRSVLLLTHAMLVALMKEDTVAGEAIKAPSAGGPRKKRAGKLDESDAESGEESAGSDDDFWNDIEGTKTKKTKGSSTGKDKKAALKDKDGPRQDEWDDLEERFVGQSTKQTPKTPAVGSKRPRAGTSKSASSSAVPSPAAASAAAATTAPSLSLLSVRAFCRSTIALRANVIVVDEAHKVQTSPNLLAALNTIDALRSRKVQETLSTATGKAVLRHPFATAIVASAVAPGSGEATSDGKKGRPSTTYNFDSDEDKDGDVVVGWGEGRVPPSPLALFEFFGSLTPPLLKIALTGTPLGVSPSSSSVTAPGPKGELMSILPWVDKTPSIVRHTSEVSKELALRHLTQVRSLRVVSHLLPPLFHATVLVKHSEAQVAMLRELVLSEQERGAIQPKRMLELVTRFLWIGNHCDLVAHWARGKGAVGPDGKVLPDAQRRMKFRGRASVEWAIPSLGLPSPLSAQLGASGEDKQSVVRATVDSLQHSPKMLVLMHLLHQSLMANPPAPQTQTQESSQLSGPTEYPEKVAVFSHSVRTLFIMGLVLASCSDLRDGVDFAVMSGSMSSTIRDELIGRYNDPTDPLRILFLSHRSFDTGTTLTGGCRVILYDVSHRPHDDAQAVFRVFRVGQQHPKVNVVQLVMDNRIEQRLCGVGVVVEQRKEALELAAAGRSGKATGRASKVDLLDEEHLDFGKALSAQALLNSIIPVDKPVAQPPASSSSKSKAAAPKVMTDPAAELSAEGLPLLWNVIKPLKEFASCDPLLAEALYPFSTAGDAGGPSQPASSGSGCVPYISHVVVEQLM